MDLHSINSIIFFEQEVKCQTCLCYKLIKHLEEKFLYKDGAFVRIEIDEPKECHLLEKVYAGIRLKDRDYKAMNECSSYVEKKVWDGVSENLVEGVGSILNYIFLSSNVRVTVDDVFQILVEVEHKKFNSSAETTTSLNEQFREEQNNYVLFESVRRQILASES